MDEDAEATGLRLIVKTRKKKTGAVDGEASLIGINVHGGEGVSSARLTETALWRCLESWSAPYRGRRRVLGASFSSSSHCRSLQ